MNALGQLIDGGPQRDAIHVAIIPVIAGELLHASQHVGIQEGSGREAYPTVVADREPIGIVDPFLRGVLVKPGQKCWVMLYPGSVTEMRHHWVCPAIDYVPQQSVIWLGDFAKNAGIPMEELIERIKEYCRSGDPYVQHGGQSMSDAFYGVDSTEFWRHVKIVTGLTPPDDPKYSPFACSC